MKTTSIILFLASILALTQHDPIDKAFWLIGTWERQSKRGARYETWHRDAAGYLQGMGFAASNGDTTKLEGLRLFHEDGVLVYAADVAENAREVLFPTTMQNDSVFVFENLDHDYPKRIVYRRVGMDSLEVYTEAATVGEKRIWFRFSRIHL